MLPRSKFDALPETARYCFLLLGHVHDEISWLQRMAYAASRAKIRKSAIEKSGKMMQATFLCRLLLGKLFEFRKVMIAQNSPIQQFITDYFEPADRAAGAAKVAAIQEFYRTEKWIRVARNKHFLHYPTIEDVSDTLNDPMIEWHPEVVHGEHSANTLYLTSDVMANYAWFRLANPDNPMQGFDEALNTLRELAQLTLSAIEQSLGHFIDVNLMALSDHKKISLPVSQTLNDVDLNYFVKTEGVTQIED